MKRAVTALKKYGFVGFMIKFFKKLFFKLYKKFELCEVRIARKRDPQYKELIKKCTSNKYKTVFVFYPYTEWDIPVFQRPQQIALSLTKHEDVLYLFCTKNSQYDLIQGLYKKIKDNLYVVVDFDFIDKLKIKNKVIHLYSTDTISKYNLVEKSIKAKDKVLYEYIDEIHESITGDIPHSFYVKHKNILKNESVSVVATADKLLDDVKKVRKSNYILSTNGVTLEDFVVKNKKVPDQIKKIKEKYKKTICYYGSLAVWFDYELLKKCAERYPNYAFVLIGFEYDDAFKKSKVQEYENVIYLGKIDYKKLIDYTSNVDLLTIPFLINDVTESTSPVKLFEYMATQKPILTTALPECRKYDSVLIGENHEDYLEKIEVALKLCNDKKYKKIELDEASANTWDSKADQILELVNK